MQDASVAGEEFQVWNLKVHSDRSATVFCDEGNGSPVYMQEIPWLNKIWICLQIKKMRGASVVG
ncbi:DUF6876 family protein [Edaphobacter sp.]|uniref:DUF6876 family protein n=1 Tax=Edaphobacter sp. TaxID=1934404 RepID=UPI0039C8BB65